MNQEKKEQKPDIKDSAQFSIVNEKVLASLTKTLKLIPSSMMKVSRDKILYNMIKEIHNKIKIPL